MITVFVILALVQLYVPAGMIMDREAVLKEGTDFKFRTAPVDPYDPFRGKYITLHYEANKFEVSDAARWQAGEAVYVAVSADTAGFVKIDAVFKEKPADKSHFVKAKLLYINDEDPYDKLEIEYPFDRFYMEESKAMIAEESYRQSQFDSASVTYALISIKEGNAVLKDVFIDGIPIREIVERVRQNNNRHQTPVRMGKIQAE